MEANYFLLENTLFSEKRQNCLNRNVRKRPFASAQSDQSLRYPHGETFVSLAIKNAHRDNSDQHAQVDLNILWAHMP